MPNSHAPFFNSILKMRRLRDEVPDQKMWGYWWWGKKYRGGSGGHGQASPNPGCTVCGTAPKGAVTPVENGWHDPTGGYPNTVWDLWRARAG